MARPLLVQDGYPGRQSALCFSRAMQFGGKARTEKNVSGGLLAWTRRSSEEAGTERARFQNLQRKVRRIWHKSGTFKSN